MKITTDQVSFNLEDNLLQHIPFLHDYKERTEIRLPLVKCGPMYPIISYLRKYAQKKECGYTHFCEIGDLSETRWVNYKWEGDHSWESEYFTHMNDVNDLCLF